jgi:hypothetical protein
VSEKQRYVGMNIHDAKRIALEAGEQLRILTHGERTLRYAEPAADDHIQVHVKDNIVTRVV